MKKEAVRRMRKREFAPEYVEAFEKEDAMVLAEALGGKNFLIHERDERLGELADRLWDEKGVLAFAGCLEHGYSFGQPVGNVWSLFCVEPDKARWAKAAELEDDGFETAFVIYPDHAQIERVLTRSLLGALARIKELEDTVGSE